jgi:hypothetical protein
MQPLAEEKQADQNAKQHTFHSVTEGSRNSYDTRSACLVMPRSMAACTNT